MGCSTRQRRAAQVCRPPEGRVLRAAGGQPECLQRILRLLRHVQVPKAIDYCGLGFASTRERTPIYHRYVRLIPGCDILFRTLSRSMLDMVLFLMMFTIIFFGFVASFYSAYAAGPVWVLPGTQGINDYSKVPMGTQGSLRRVFWQVTLVSPTVLSRVHRACAYGMGGLAAAMRGSMSDVDGMGWKPSQGSSSD